MKEKIGVFLIMYSLVFLISGTIASIGNMFGEDGRMIFIFGMVYGFIVLLFN